MTRFSLLLDQRNRRIPRRIPLMGCQTTGDWHHWTMGNPAAL